MPADHDDPLLWDDDGVDAPWQAYIVGSCTACESPFVRDSSGAFCVNDACHQSEEGRNRELAALSDTAETAR